MVHEKEKEDRAFSRRLIGSTPHPTLVNKGNASTKREKRLREREVGRYSPCFR
jgi:hypothetical protein